MIRALLIILFLPAYTLLASLIGYGLARLSGSPALLYGLGRFGIRVALFLAGTRIVVEGRHLLGDARNTVIVANHVSHLDAPVLLQALGVDFRAVAKKEVFYVPVFSSVLRSTSCPTVAFSASSNGALVFTSTTSFAAPSSRRTQDGWPSWSPICVRRST